MESSLQNIIFHVWEPSIAKFLEKMKGTPIILFWKMLWHIFTRIYFWIIFSIYISFEYTFLKMFWWRRGSGNGNCSINEFHKSLDVNFISIKNMKLKFANMYQTSSGNIHIFWNKETKQARNLFYFQDRESYNMK